MDNDKRYYDELETRDPQLRHQQQMVQLTQQIAFAKSNTSAYAKLLEGVDPQQFDSLEALSQLPVTRKSELLDAQAENKPFGGFAINDVSQLSKVFSSPGPIYEPEAACKDYWRIARAMYAAGIRAQDLVHNTFSYHFTPAGSMMENAAQAIGCRVFPAGTGQTELQARTIADLQASAYAGTPSFLNIIINKAAELGIAINSLKHALVSGEALPASLRQEINNAGISVLQAYATADVGLIAYESEAMDGMIIDENIIVEIVRPGTGDPVPQGDVGEVVVTSFNRHYPLLRFATGDMSAIMPGQSPCGRTNQRIKGWMGRADQTAKVKGMFVHPKQVAQVLKRHPQINKARLVISSEDHIDQLQLHCETGSPSDDLKAALQTSIRDVIKLRADVNWAEVGSLANDGKVIDDTRSFD